MGFTNDSDDNDSHALLISQFSSILREMNAFRIKSR